MSTSRSKTSEAAMHDFDAHAIEKQHPLGSEDAVPPAENGDHAQSPAAHLKEGGDPRTKPEGNLRQGSNPGALREPPMVTERVGKLHRG